LRRKGEKAVHGHAQGIKDQEGGDLEKRREAKQRVCRVNMERTKEYEDRVHTLHGASVKSLARILGIALVLKLEERKARWLSCHPALRIRVGEE
jgi:hypothetical protein